VPGAAELTRTDYTESVESAGGRHRERTGLADLAAGEDSQHIGVAEAVGMEAQRLEVLLGSGTLAIPLR
jgi:hypothetical protein